MTSKSTIFLARVPQYADRFRAYKAFLDGAEVGRIQRDQTMKLDVDPGDHEIFLTIDWVSSNKLVFRVKPNEEVYLECGNNIKVDWNPLTIFRVLGAVTVVRSSYLYVKRQS